jgi:signal transduction protein with GAF and PtsI domain
LTTFVRTVFEDLTEAGSDAAIAVSTIAVVALLTPVKNQLQALVDRYFKEDRSPARQIGKQVGDARQILRVLYVEDFVPDFLDGLNKALGVQGSRLELSDGSGTMWRRGEWEGVVGLEVPVRYKGELLGALSLGPRLGGREYQTEEMDALNEAAEVLALALVVHSHSPAPSSQSLSLSASTRPTALAELESN